MSNRLVYLMASSGFILIARRNLFMSSRNKQHRSHWSAGHT